MQSIEDSAKVHSMAGDEEAFMGTTDESKVPTAKDPMVGLSTSKRKRAEQNANEQEADAPKKRKGGRLPLNIQLILSLMMSITQFQEKIQLRGKDVYKRFGVTW